MSHSARIDYTVRVSDRARRARLTVTARDGLVVVVPRGWRGDAATLVDARSAWAHEALSRVAERRSLHVAGPAALLPKRVELRAACESLTVVYSGPAAAPARARRAADTVVVSGNGDPAARLAALERWLARAARDVLVPRVHALAAHHGLEPGVVRVRRVRSRWGSCSSRGNVSLSRNLAFLPTHLVDALILHELAHLAHLDHSHRFHAHLATLDPEAREHHHELRTAGRFVPVWAEV